MPLLRYLRSLVAELGLRTLWHAALDVKLLCLQRFVRLFAYGAATLVLVAFLQQLGVSGTRVGLFMTLTLAGDVAISFVLTLFADRLGRKAVLAAGAVLVAASGIVFAWAVNYWLLLAAAVFGVISPSGNEIGPFRAIEESVVAHLTAPVHRSDVYAWYGLAGTAGTAFGMMACGWTVHELVVARGWPLLAAYRLVFVAYALLGVVKFVLAMALSRAVEAEEKTATARVPSPPPATTLASEGTPLLHGNSTPNDQDPPPRWTLRALLPEIDKGSISVVAVLCFLFALDSFASGLAPLSWITFYFRSRYNLEEGKLGSVFFVTSIISAFSMLVASSLARRFGNVNTMVFTHLPSAVFLALIPAPHNVHISLLFLVLRACTQSMDAAPRSAFVAAVIPPQERTATMGLLNVVKTTAQALGPLITGVLADRHRFWVSFVCAGSLKASYDLGLLAVFKNHERDVANRAHAAAAGGASERSDDDRRHA
ncbi:Major facilitator superfamily domain, general substrate transporter [Niveomyces insectorum RCEF 264]|uniref:Major facilitator superfamily domain, general substrate transporter n=1 Tax=Niveomyces insectorum RCEF 264 TaxID=1081102 RepID=A0A167USP3_9HYPO|nr:Major facilitator superfamily domain, general substrate transporter [Niveomyces insectorum RCEF 264]